MAPVESSTGHPTSTPLLYPGILHLHTCTFVPFTNYIPFRNNDSSWKQQTLCIYFTSLSRCLTSTILPPFSLMLLPTCISGTMTPVRSNTRPSASTPLSQPASCSVYHYHPQHCYTINTTTADVSVYYNGHHPDCETEDHQKTT